MIVNQSTVFFLSTFLYDHFVNYVIILSIFFVNWKATANFIENWKPKPFFLHREGGGGRSNIWFFIGFLLSVAFHLLWMGFCSSTIKTLWNQYPKFRMIVGELTPWTMVNDRRFEFSNHKHLRCETNSELNDCCVWNNTAVKATNFISFSICQVSLLMDMKLELELVIDWICNN